MPNRHEDNPTKSFSSVACPPNSCAISMALGHAHEPGRSTMTTLSGKTALVTGSSRGIGRAAALALAKRGAQIIVHYGQAKNEADAVVAAIRAGGGKADSVATDLAATDSAAKLAQHVRGIVGERLDILVANAGIFKVATLE